MIREIVGDYIYFDGFRYYCPKITLGEIFEWEEEDG